MWYVLISEILFLSLFVILRAPKSWFRNRLFLISFIIFHSVGLCSVIALLWFFYRMEDPLIKKTIVFIVTVYVSFLLFAFVLSLYRGFLLYASRHVKNMKTRDAILSPAVFWSMVTVLSVLYLIPAMKNADNIVKTTYHISADLAEPLKIAMVSDLHIGAGANRDDLDSMVKIVNEMDADCLMICGDITDSSTSLSDMEYLEECLKKIETTYGIYAVEGNHEEQCHYDILPYLKDADVIFLDDEMSLLSEEVAVIGLDDRQNGNIDFIIKENDLKDRYTIVLKHRPVHIKEMEGDADLVLCGHSHGYQYPFMAVMAPQYDPQYGLKTFHDMTAITSSGLAQWSYHCKWPSHCEVLGIIIE